MRDVLVGAAAAVLAFAAVPGVLAGLVGVPFPTHWTRQAVVSLHGLFDVLAIAAWIAWAACAWPLLRSVVARVRARDASGGGLPSGLRWGDRLALRIAAAVLAVAPVVATGAATAGATPLVVRPVPGAAAVQQAPVQAAAVQQAPVQPAAVQQAPVQPAAVQAGGATGRPSASPGVAVPSAAPDLGARQVEVGVGDSLWSIAQAEYDDGAAWRAIAAANLGRAMGDGARFVDPSAVRPGWTLTVPSLDPPAKEGGAGHDDRGHRGPAARPRPAPAPAPASPSGLVLPELAILGTGALVAGLLARRARQAQRLRSFVRAEGDRAGPPSTQAAELGTALGAFEHLPLLQLVEVAVRAVGMSTIAASDMPRLPPPRLVRAGTDGVEVRFASPPPPAPAPWVPGDASAWLLPASLEPDSVRTAARAHHPWMPVLLPLGDDERGSWLLPVTSGACVSIVGAAARRLVRAMVAGAQSWTWHEELVVTSDPAAAAAGARTAVERPDGSLAPRVLYTGDPRTLEPKVRRACAIVGFGALETADVCIVVDERAATAHPLGLTVRPHLVDGPTSAALGELGSLADGGAPPTPALRQHRYGAATVQVRERLARPEAAGAGNTVADGRGGRPGEVGTVDVRLLSPVPSLAGLPEALPSKRARRATEIVAYLALHGPHPVTGDRLRTRVLGTADADAASKTLFNTVAAARRALGAGPDGLPLVPPATRSGHYRLSPAVTVDARRCVALVDAGLAASAPSERTALLQAALAEVDGEPLSGVLTGYGWWRAEGHERRVADAVVDGASALVRAAVATRQVDLGRWALDKARLVEPYSEVLTRAAMALAAVAGDARRLHLEWEECRRQVDELDPGGAPSQATERLYATLRQHLRSSSPVAEPAAVLGG